MERGSIVSRKQQSELLENVNSQMESIVTLQRTAMDKNLEGIEEMQKIFLDYSKELADDYQNYIKYLKVQEEKLANYISEIPYRTSIFHHIFKRKS